MTANQTAGRQGLVSSVWWGPAATLSVLPLAFTLRADPLGLAPIATSVCFGAAVLLLLERALRRRGAGWWRIALVAAVGMDPMFVRECISGSSTPLIGALLLMAADSLAGWFEARRLRDLVRAGLALGILPATGFDVWGWVVAAVLILAIAEGRRPHEPGEWRAVLVLGLLPTLYVLGLWVLLCWLIMGDPLYLVRSLAARGPGPGLDFAMSMPLAAGYGCMMGIAVIAALVALSRRERGEVPLTLLALALPATAGLLAWRGWLWSPAPLLVAMPSLVAMSVARVLVGRSNARLAGWVVGIAALAASVFPYGRPPVVDRPGEREGSRDAAMWLHDLDLHVHQQSRFVKVFVCGYDSFALLRDRGTPATFVHALDFNFDKAKHDYYGHTLFVLVRQPEQRHAMDSVHWKYPRIFIQGGPDTLYDSDWGEWRLFELIQAPQAR